MARKMNQQLRIKNNKIKNLMKIANLRTVGRKTRKYLLFA